MIDFSDVLNTSIAASWMVLAIIVLRFLLRKIPKWIHVAFWGLVAIRLVLPFSIESAFSLIPSAQTVPTEILKYEGMNLNTPAHLDVISNPVFSGDVSVQLGQTVDRVQVQLVNMTSVWFLGMAIMLLYTGISYWNLHRKVKTAVLLRDNIYQSEYVNSPFVLGIIKPRIYLPFHMEEQEIYHVLAHEYAHIKRKDHWWKPLGFLLLAVHWFNPLLWLAYVLFCRDMELACDEKVIKELDSEQKADYSQALLTCSVNRHMVAACPLAFGEMGVKMRVKSVLNYRKPAFWMIVLGVVVSILLAVCFLTNPENETNSILSRILKLDSGYEIVLQYNRKVTLTIPVSQLPESIFTEEGQSFGKNEMVAYEDENTMIYLKKAQSNEGNEELYFGFDFMYDLEKTEGSFLYPSVIRDMGSVSEWDIVDGTLRAGNAEFANAVAVRREDGSSTIWFAISAEALRQAEGDVSFDIYLNRIKYKKGPTAQIAKKITGNWKTYYQMSDGTWMADGQTYKYRLVITGRDSKAIKDSTYVYLSNLENITFEQAVKASGLSSNTSDYFKVEDAVLVERQ